jgi:ABC-type multidrug transport system ATPase subunit
MEEADVLCSRIGIVDKGVLRCVGPSQRLKNMYGGGYHLFINVHKQKYLARLDVRKDQAQMIAETKAFVAELLPHANLVTDFNGSLIYLVPLEGTLVSKIFKDFETHKDEVGISDWGISQCSLEDVFLHVIDDDE